jgi:hypothetical protein
MVELVGGVGGYPREGRWCKESPYPVAQGEGAKGYFNFWRFEWELWSASPIPVNKVW